MTRFARRRSAIWILDERSVIWMINAYYNVTQTGDIFGCCCVQKSAKPLAWREEQDGEVSKAGDWSVEMVLRK